MKMLMTFLKIGIQFLTGCASFELIFESDLTVELSFTKNEKVFAKDLTFSVNFVISLESLSFFDTYSRIYLLTTFLCNNKYYTFFCKKNKKRKGTSFSQNKQFIRNRVKNFAEI